MIFLASYGAYGGGSIGDLLAQWESLGVFAYALPFLLIFALVYAILSFINVFKDNKAVNAVIALAVALMALQFNIVSMFFADIFPRLGIALSIILVMIILGGLFIDPKDTSMKWILFIVILVIVVIVLWGPLRNLGFGYSGTIFTGRNIGNIILAVIFIGLIIAIIAGNNKVRVGAPPIKYPNQ
jgi:hypothetical protein